MTRHVVDEMYLEVGLDTSKYDKQSAKLKGDFDAIKTKGEAAEKGVSKSSKSLAGMAGSLKAVSGAVLAFGGAIAGVASGLGILAGRTASANVSLGNVSKNIGISATELKQWEYAANMAGGSAEATRATLTGLSGAINDLTLKGDTSMLPFFNAVGTSILDSEGKARNLRDVMLDLADAFAKMDRAQAYSIAQSMGIDDGTFNMLARGRQETQRQLDAAAEHAKTTEADIKASEQLIESKARLSMQFDALSTKLGNSLIPALTSLLELLNRFVDRPADTAKSVAKSAASSVTSGARSAAAKIRQGVSPVAQAGASYINKAVPSRQYGKAKTVNVHGGVYQLSQRDIDDILRVTATEATHSLKGNAYNQQVAGIVDTIINRGAKTKGGIRAAVNARWQFSDINAPRKTAYGSVQNVPWSRVTPKLRAAVMQHLQYRASGGQSIIGGNTHYANPNYLGEASASTKAWVRQAEAQARQTGYKFGSGRAVHVHGTPVGSDRLPQFRVTIPAQVPMRTASSTNVNVNNVTINTTASTMTGAGKDMAAGIRANISAYNPGVM